MFLLENVWVVKSWILEYVISFSFQEQGLLEASVGGTQKQLSFEATDILTDATMFDGDKVHFNISTNRETKEERAINVEILSETFEESTERRRTVRSLLECGTGCH